MGYTSNTIDERWADCVKSAHKNLTPGRLKKAVRDKTLSDAIILYGSVNWDHEVLMECDSLIDTLEHEQRLIAEFKTKDDGYNQTIGGEIPSRMRIDQIKKLLNKCNRS